MSWEVVPHRNTPQLGDGCSWSWKDRLLVDPSGRWSVKNQEKFRGVSDSSSASFHNQTLTLNWHLRKSVLCPRHRAGGLIFPERSGPHAFVLWSTDLPCSFEHSSWLTAERCQLWLQKPLEESRVPSRAMFSLLPAQQSYPHPATQATMATPRVLICVSLIIFMLTMFSFLLF